MRDIVERLRESCATVHMDETTTVRHELIEEAADEIERLRNECGKAKKALQEEDNDAEAWRAHWHKRAIVAESRVAELEAALKPFANIKPSTLYSDEDNEAYTVVLTSEINMPEDDPRSPVDFTRFDIIRARAAIKKQDGG